MSRTENVELTVLCLVSDGKKLLLQNRIKNDWPGYTLPGGHVEPGESITDAVIREMKEETGLDILHPRLVGVKQFPIEDGRYIVFLFKATDFTGTISSSEEGQVEWVLHERLQVLKTFDFFEELLKVMNEPECNELQYLEDEENEWKVVIK